MATATLGMLQQRTPCLAALGAQSGLSQAEAPAPRTDSRGPTFLSQKQRQSVKLFFVRASRPLSENDASAQRAVAAHAPAAGPLSEAEELVALQLARGSDPLPLHVQQELVKAAQVRVAETASPAVAQGRSPAWPAVGWSREDTAGPAEFEISEKDEDVEADRQSLESLLLAYPRCAWPRRSVARQNCPDSFSVAYPRCSWPRAVTSTSQASALAASQATALYSLAGPLVDTQVETLAEAPAVSEESMYPRSAWPRRSTVRQAATRPMVTNGGREEDILFLKRMFAGGSHAVGPHCAWPRQAGKIAKTSLTSLAPAPLVGPHCSWPRRAMVAVSAATGPEVVAQAARCA